MKTNREVEEWVTQELRRLRDDQQLTIYWRDPGGHLHHLAGPWAKRQELVNLVASLTVGYQPKLEAYRGAKRIEL